MSLNNNHRVKYFVTQHEEACKKRVTKLRDELLFKQPESTHLGDCPICMLPLSLDGEKRTLNTCCSKLICRGCDFSNKLREVEMRHVTRQSCPFCREPLPRTNEEQDKQLMKRIEADDPVAMRQEGAQQCHKGDYNSAFEYFTKAAALGNAEAHYQLAILYCNGLGVEKDGGKEIYHTEEAVIGGHPFARNNLGYYEEINGNFERAVKHWIIAATQGEDHAIEALKSACMSGDIKEKVLDAALRAHQASKDATRSPQREAAEEYYRRKEILGVDRFGHYIVAETEINPDI